MTAAEMNRVLSLIWEQRMFEHWDQSQPQRQWSRVFAYEYGTIWKFGALEWWKFVQAVVEHSGKYDLPLSRALKRRPNVLCKDENGRFQSSDASVRCINLRAWTLADWKRELGPTESEPGVRA